MSPNPDTLDAWDQHGPLNYFRSLPSSTVVEAVTGECESLMIDGEPPADVDAEKHVWWLSHPAVQGSSMFDTLAEAKAAGDAVIEELETALPMKMAKAASLDTDTWRYAVYSDPPSFMHRTDSDASIEHLGGDQWALWTGGDDPVGIYASPAACADAYLATPAPGI